MPSLKNFSLYESSIKTINFNTTPYSLSSDNVIVEIDSENRKYVVSSNVEMMVNADKSYFSHIETNDLICFNDEFIVFNEFNEETGHADNVFLGNVKKNILVFRLPKKISKGPFSEIFKVAEHYPGPKKIYIDCSSTLFMDSKSVSGMMELIEKSEYKENSICFYKPSYKFLTYLKLANIEKNVPVKESGETFIDHFIDKKQFADKKQMKNNYVITDKADNYVAAPENVISVGRLNNTCDIVLSDENISRIHALIINIHNSLYVIDCHSTNFTYINGWKIPPYRLNQLKVNDTIVFGRNACFNIKQI